LALLASLLLPAQTGLGATEERMLAARERMLERLPEINHLWNRGLTGESSEGFVVSRSTLREAENELIEDENRDRMILYRFIAEETGADHLEVGRKRAELIAAMAKRGLWIQTPSGEWIRTQSRFSTGN